MLVAMAATLAGLPGCTSRGWEYYRDSGQYRDSGKDYPTYDYEGNRLMLNEGGWHINKGSGY